MTTATVLLNLTQISVLRGLIHEYYTTLGQSPLCDIEAAAVSELEVILAHAEDIAYGDC